MTDPWVTAAQEQEDCERQTVIEKTGDLTISGGNSVSNTNSTSDGWGGDSQGGFRSNNSSSAFGSGIARGGSTFGGSGGAAQSQAQSGAGRGFGTTFGGSSRGGGAADHGGQFDNKFGGQWNAGDTAANATESSKETAPAPQQSNGGRTFGSTAFGASSSGASTFGNRSNETFQGGRGFGGGAANRFGSQGGKGSFEGSQFGAGGRMNEPSRFDASTPPFRYDQPPPNISNSGGGGGYDQEAADNSFGERKSSDSSAGGLGQNPRRASQEAGGEIPIWTSNHQTMPPVASADSFQSSFDEDARPAPKADIALLNKLVHKKLEEVGEVQIKLPNQQQDPTSPLYSVKSFEDLRLKESLVKALYKMGFQQPSKIQEAALPILLVEPPQNLIAQSQSGTGKTAAFVLTMLSRVKAEDKFAQCICLAPTYELALQIGKVVEEMSQFMPDVKLRYAIRGEMVERGQKVQEQIIIGTPGKMLDWLIKYRCIDATKIKCFVLDEADVMISQQGHQDQSVRIHNEIERANPNCQCLLFSATYDDQVVAFAETIIPNPMLITLRPEEQALNNIKQFYVLCSGRDDKYEAMLNLYGGLTIGSAIIFCYTRKSAAWLTERLQQRGHAVTLLTGELPIEERALIIQQFKDGHHKVLITTNVCARGIDVSQVSIVINYDPPITVDKQPDFETYLHRIGRTGRFGKAGIAINFCDSDFAFSIIKAIADHFGKPIEQLDTADTEQLEAIEKE
uniref:RNA helicase n=1 Tax=Plectus sambesii TaxID=2011161 RepID=A0A914W256_9BILA